MTADVSSPTVELYTWVRHERAARGLSQSKLAWLTGFSQARLSNFELGKTIPSPQEESVIRGALVRFDSDKAAGQHLSYMKKTKWSEAYAGSKRLGRGTRSAVSMDDAAEFASTAIVSAQWSHALLSESARAETSPKCISLFSGCGGLTAGFVYAGFQAAAHVEIDDAARSVYEQNFPGSLELATDIRQLTDADVRAVCAKMGKVSVVVGGPPCQGFSLTGKRDVYDPRNQLYKEFARIVDLLRPDVFVMENVRLMTSMRTPAAGLLIEDVYRTFETIGYQVDHASLNAMNFGVPQFRERVVVIGTSNGVAPSFPQATHSSSGAVSLFSQKHHLVRTLRDAIGDLQSLESGEVAVNGDPLHVAVSHPSHVIEMLKDVPEGCSAHDHPDETKRPRSGYNTTYKRLRWDEPSSTISTTFGMISGSRNVHPTSTRSLTCREAARCQTFPDDYQFFGKVGQIRCMIGNAVPPRFAREIAEHVRRNLLAHPM